MIVPKSSTCCIWFFSKTSDILMSLTWVLINNCMRNQVISFIKWCDSEFYVFILIIVAVSFQSTICMTSDTELEWHITQIIISPLNKPSLTAAVKIFQQHNILKCDVSVNSQDEVFFISCVKKFRILLHKQSLSSYHDFMTLEQVGSEIISHDKNYNIVTKKLITQQNNH